MGAVIVRYLVQTATGVEQIMAVPKKRRIVRRCEALRLSIELRYAMSEDNVIKLVAPAVFVGDA